MNQILLVLKDNLNEEVNQLESENTGGTEMVDEKDLDDLDDTFETGEIQTNDISEESDMDLIDSYVATDDDYKETIENNTVEEKESEVNETEESNSEETEEDSTDLLIDENDEDSDMDLISEEIPKPENPNVIQSAEDYLNEINGNSEESETDILEDEEESENDENDIVEEKSEEIEQPVEESNEEPEEIVENTEESEQDIIDSMVNPQVEDKETEIEEDEKSKSMTSPLDLDDEPEDDEDIVEEKTYSVDSTDEAEEDVVKTKNETINPMSSYSDFKKSSFWKAVEEYQNKYSEESLNTYLEKFQNDEGNKTILTDYYTNIVIQYGEYVNFGEDEDARHYAWILAAGKFADLIERRKEMGLIESSVEVTNLGKSEINRIEDERISNILKDRDNYNKKINKYAIDRTVFAIADDSAEEISPFEDKKAVDKEFYESPFYKTLKEVMTSDRFADMSKIYMKVIINPDTAFIPIVDFSTGIRFVCVDSSDVDQYRIHALALARQIPFSFQGKRRNEIRTRVLYSDMCRNRPVATVFAIKKLVAAEYWNKRNVITLQNNFAVAYTTETKYVELFENGDPDSKNAPENCVNITKKPKNCSIGILAMYKKSERDRQALRRRQGKKILERIANGGNNYGEEDISAVDYDIHFIIGADIICNDRDLVNPAIAPQDRCVHYQITRYCECNPSIILDGLQTVCTAIIKEHFKKYGRTTKYSIEFEYDPTELLTPGVMSLIDNHDGVEESTYKRSNPMSIVSTYIMPPSRLKMEGVFDFERGRVDGRNFNAATLSVSYPRELWSRYNINTIEGRAEFLRSRGFEEFWQPAVAVFDVMPYVLKIIEVGSFINELCDISVQGLSDRDSTDMDNLLYQQQKIEYFKKLEKSDVSGFKKFLITCFDVMMDFFSGNNQN